MISFDLNGKSVSVDVPEDTPLLWVLRDELKMTGTKYGCGIAQCGACTVMLDGTTRRSCVTPVASVEGSSIQTIEGLEDEVSDAVQEAWTGIDVPQCGWCQSGQVLSATALLRETPKPTDEDIDGAMSGNICRCATY